LRVVVERNPEVDIPAGDSPEADMAAGDNLEADMDTVAEDTAVEVAVVVADPLPVDHLGVLPTGRVKL
jgi:hypothetical protein